MQNKSLLGGLIAAAAVYAFYRISRMSDEEKSALKEKGKKIINDALGAAKNATPAQSNQTAGN